MNGSDEKIIEKIDWKAVAAFLFCVLFAAAAVYVAIKYAFPILLPFIIAWALSLVTDPIAERLSKRLKIGKKPLSVLLTAALLALIFLILSRAVTRLVFEAERLIEWLASDSGRLGESIASLFDKITSVGNKRIPLIENLMRIDQLRDVLENLDKITAEAISAAVSALTRSIPSVAIGVLGSLPSLILFLAVTVISCFYFATGLDKIGNALLSILPKKWQAGFPHFKKRMYGTALRYVRAYLLLLILTFCQLFAGFLMIGVQYPLLLALLVALVDFLPILGVGTVLIPWSIIEILFVKDAFTGVGLLILYAIVAVVRQVTEPKIVAGSLGLDPLLTIVVMYAGLKLFGLLGIILGPIAALGAKAFFKGSGVQNG